jgi:archaemetzincin
VDTPDGRALGGGKTLHLFAEICYLGVGTSGIGDRQFFLPWPSARDEEKRMSKDRMRSTSAYLCMIAISSAILAMAWLLDAAVRSGMELEEGELPPTLACLRPLHTKKGKPEPGDWLSKHTEWGQTYEQYLRSHPVRVDEHRTTIYIQPLGEFTPSEKRIIETAAEFFSIYFQLPVKVRDPLSMNIVPPSAWHKRTGGRADQIHTTYVLDKVLSPRLPPDAIGLSAFTKADLWPGEGWNRVFGQASLTEYVSVWSIHCFGDPAADEESYRRCLLRALKTGSHEIGHMFSLSHCIFYECNLCGVNSLRESDRRPIELCPDCLAKICFATGGDPVKRFRQLIKFYGAHGFKNEQEFCEKSLAKMKCEP